MSNLVVGKLAFVTGAGSGIGRETCRILAREGAKVIAVDQNLKMAEDTVKVLNGADHIALKVNITDPHDVEQAFKHTVKQYSTSPTIIVNSAGITRENFILKLSETEFNDVINVNLKGTFLIMQNAVKTMIETGQTEGSSIINIASIVGKTGNIGQGNYSASKAGVEALTKTASMEFGKLGIRVNAVLPGFIETPMTDTIPEKVKTMFVNRISFKRMGKPKEVAEVITFLASNRSSYVNGASIEVTGGLH
ncbi:PREDICTED: estradiol 17-beta-dehydrogenase 8-like isoform X1 [Polistes canadensis]|uniref:estradiol 17-beta-dehydrogenase 8-like isoform X1 n=1 Tax=Polistes canadensis TaxID=91411 RepID=UPI000718C306|nr:PREDICTED: estradiol 17-beta-dehydrogenase 8-like isoform X1 [Polistes canadensis]